MKISIRHRPSGNGGSVHRTAHIRLCASILASCFFFPMQAPGSTATPLEDAAGSGCDLEAKQPVQDGAEDPSATISPADKKKVVLTTTAVGIGAVTVWGVLNWDYFTRAPNSGSEGWFGEDTSNGGVDKLGHLYTSYVFTHGLAYLYEHWNFSREDAALYGSLTSLAVMGYMEFGDSFSDYGFSYEDMIMNAAGTLFAYLIYMRPELASKIDLRCQFGFQFSQWDFFTDYENLKFLLVLKLNGFESVQKTFLKHVELHLGYHAEGFEDPDEEKERHVYVGVGFNLTDLFRRHGYKKTATVFNYIQLPYTSVNYDFDL